MITILAERIDSGKLKSGQETYIRNVVEYITQEFTEPKKAEELEKAKCVATIYENFSSPVISPSEAIFEMASDCASAPRLRDGQGLDHWVLSFNGTEGEKPTIDQVLTAARVWMEEMGYGEPRMYKWMASIYDNTEHRHVHIAVCRINSLTGKVKPRGWHVNDSMRAVAITAHRLKFSTEEGNNFRATGEKITVRVRDEVMQEEKEKEVFCVEEVKVFSKNKKHNPGNKIARFEREANRKSEIRKLGEQLSEVYEEVKDALPNMKWGQLHKALAMKGISMERRQHGDKFGLVFSMDGKNWAPASKVCKDMTWPKLEKNIGAKTGWRDANHEITELLENVRSEIAKNDKTENAKSPEEPQKSKSEKDQGKEASKEDTPKQNDTSNIDHKKVF